MDGFSGLFNFKKKRAAIYTRVSTNEQYEKGQGLNYQKDICEKMCSMKNYEIIDYFEDGAVSGTVPAEKRKEFSRFLELAAQKKFDVLVFYAFDRLAREIRVFLNIVDELRKYGIKIVSCKENVDTSSDSGDFMMNIYASVANLELRTIRSRLMNGRLQKISTTGYAGGRIPYGYIAVNKVVTIEPETSRIVKKIFELHKKGVSMNRIADLLTMEKVPPPRNGLRWYAKGISVILKNKEKYSGVLMNDNKNGIMWPKILK